MVDLKYWGGQTLNIGDQLAPIIVEWIVNSKAIQDKSRKTVNLLTLGSILAADFFHDDAVVWGTGIHYIEDAGRLTYRSGERKLDIHAVRGPVTRRALEQAGYSCPHVYGDPAILMPMIYPSKKIRTKGKISVIRHIQNAQMKIPQYVNKIDVRTKDYKKFIDEITSSERIISSSLHGIILSESYGIPSVFLLEHENAEFIKFFDWYYSTQRSNIKIAHTIEEAIDMEPMELPKIESMQKKLMYAFPTEAYQADYCYGTKREIVLFGAGHYFQCMVDRIKRNVRVRYVCDNDCSKWGMYFQGLECISPEQLYDMKNIYVVIMIEQEKYAKEIEKQLDYQKIEFYERAEQWLRHMNYKCFWGNSDNEKSFDSLFTEEV